MIEQLTGTTYAFTLPTGDKVEIGDILSLDFKPHLKLKRWGEECSLDLDLATSEKIASIISGEKILWSGKNYGAEFFQSTDGFKFNIVLPKKPLSNIFPLSFNSNNLNFYYQPELTPEEIAEGCFRPENVIGSYAVYHATKRNHILGQTNYMNGKAFHWYRPLIYDAVGKQTWGILNISGGQRTVTIPQTFLDTAIYPVTIDDEFGYHPTGVPASTTPLGDWIKGILSTPAGAGTGVSISAYISGTATTSTYKFGLYSGTDFIDNGTTKQGTYSGTAGWNTQDFTSAPTLTAIEYAICAWALFVSPTNGPFLKYDSATATMKTKSATYGTWPDPITWGTDNANWKSGIYCTYSTAGGGLSIPIVMHHYNQLRSQ